MASGEHPQRLGSVTVLALLAVTGVPALTRAQSDDRPPSAVWTEPVPAGVLAVSGAVYVPLGIHLPIGLGRDVTLQGTFTRARWYWCSTNSTGAWLEGGISFANSEGRGWFVAQKLLLRFFSTSGGATHSGEFLSDPCTEKDVSALQGIDGDTQVGLDFGYVVWRAPVFLSFGSGVHAGACWNCPGDGPFSPDFQLFGHPDSARTTHATLGFSLALVRVGVGL